MRFAAGMAGAWTLLEHYRFQYTELQRKGEEAECRENPTSKGLFFIIT